MLRHSQTERSSPLILQDWVRNQFQEAFTSAQCFQRTGHRRLGVRQHTDVCGISLIVTTVPQTSPSSSTTGSVTWRSQAVNPRRDSSELLRAAVQERQLRSIREAEDVHEDLFSLGRPTICPPAYPGSGPAKDCTGRPFLRVHRQIPSCRASNSTCQCPECNNAWWFRQCMCRAVGLSRLLAKDGHRWLIHDCLLNSSCEHADPKKLPIDDRAKRAGQRRTVYKGRAALSFPLCGAGTASVTLAHGFAGPQIGLRGGATSVRRRRDP